MDEFEKQFRPGPMPETCAEAIAYCEASLIDVLSAFMVLAGEAADFDEIFRDDPTNGSRLLGLVNAIEDAGVEVANLLEATGGS